MTGRTDMTVKPSELMQILLTTFLRNVHWADEGNPDRRTSLLIFGPPGIGKSDMCKQVTELASQRLQREVLFKDFRGSEWEAVEIKGVYDIEGEHTVLRPIKGVLPQDEDSTGLLLLDELGDSEEDVQNLFKRMVLDFSTGTWELPRRWSVFAASNRPEDRAGARELTTALANRFMILELADPTTWVDEWIAWATVNGIHPDVRSYVRFKPGNLYTFDPDAESAVFASPRTYEKLSDELADLGDGLNYPRELIGHVAAGLIGEGPAREFEGFLQVKNDLPELDQILEAPEDVSVPTRPAAQYAVIGSLAEIARTAGDDLATLNAIATYGQRLPAEFSQKLSLDVQRTNPFATSLTAFSQHHMKHVELLGISGSTEMKQAA